MNPTITVTPLPNPPIELALALPATFKPAACVIVAPSSHPRDLGICDRERSPDSHVRRRCG
jgi:hypothetical protein